MTKITEKMKVLLGIAKHQFGSVTTERGDLLFDGESLTIDTPVYDQEGNPIADGEYATEDLIYVVTDGKVADIKEKEEVSNEGETEESVEENMEEMPTEETTTEEVVVPEEQMDSIETRIANIETALEEMYSLIQELMAKTTEAETKADEALEFSKTSIPTAEPIQFSKENTPTEKPMTKSQLFLLGRSINKN